MPRVSVVVPVFNSERTIERCLDSILAQAFDDFELIAVNDGSTDLSRDILREYERRDDRIRIEDQANSGLGAARNAGLRVAEGDFVSFVDSDDAVHPMMLAKMMEAIEANGAQMAICQVREVVLEDGMEVATATMRIPGERTCVSGIEALSSQLSCEVPFLFNSVCFKLIERSLFADNDIWFPEGFRYSEDTPTSVNLFLCAAKVAFVRDELYEYIHEGETLTSVHSIQKAKDLCVNLEEIEAMIESKGTGLSLDCFALSMIFPIEKNVYLSSDAAVADEEEVIAHVKALRRRYTPSIRACRAPFVHKIKMYVGYLGLTRIFLFIGSHCRKTCFLGRRLRS